MPHRIDKGLPGAKCTCNMDVCRWLQRTRWETARKQVNWFPATVYQKSCYCIYSQTLELGQFGKTNICPWAGTTLTIDSRRGFLLPSQEVHTPGGKAKMCPLGTSYSWGSCSAHEVSAVLHVSFGQRLSWLFHFLSWQHHTGVNTVLSNQWKKEETGIFWWFAQADLFVVPVLAVSLASIFLEVNSWRATTSHPWTRVKNKCDIELGLYSEHNYKLTAFLGRTITDLYFHDFMVRWGPLLLLQNYSWRHLWASYLKSLIWGSTKFNFPII